MWLKEAQLLLWLIAEYDNWFLQMLCCALVAYLRARGNIFEILLQHDRFCVWTDEVNLKTADLEKEKTARQSLQRLRTSVSWGNEMRNNGDSNDVAQTNLFHVCFTI